MPITSSPVNYRLFLLVVALIHIILIPLAILALGFFVSRRMSSHSTGGRSGLALLWIAFATAVAGVPALVAGLSLDPKVAVVQISPFYFIMIFGGTIAARLPGLLSGRKLRALPFHGLIASLLAALGDILAWAFLDLVLITGFTNYIWLFTLIGLPAFLGRVAVHNFNALGQFGTPQALGNPSSVVVPGLPASQNP